MTVKMSAIETALNLKVKNQYFKEYIEDMRLLYISKQAILKTTLILKSCQIEQGIGQNGWSYQLGDKNDRDLSYRYVFKYIGSNPLKSENHMKYPIQVATKNHLKQLQKDHQDIIAYALSASHVHSKVELDI